MKKLAFIYLSLLVIGSHCYADVTSPTEWTEADGSPSVYDPWKVSVSNGTLTDNGDGSLSLTTGGGSGSPGGVTTQVQFNDAGSFGGDDGLVYNKITNNLTISGDVTISGDNITATTNTDRFVFMANGTTYAPEAINLGTDTVGNYADGTGEAGSALAGDSATAFFSTGTLEIGIGGTGVTSISNDAVLVGNNSGTGFDKPALPDCTDTGGNHLNYTAATGAFTCGTSGGTDTNSVKTYVWPMSATLPLEAADSIPPITKDTGTNNDILAVSFDDSTDECRTVNFIVPTDVQSGSTITFGMIWYSQTATTGNVIWDFRHTGTGTEGEDWDQTLTTEASAADAVQGTVDLVTRTEWTETLANLGWAADDMISAAVCRDANNASDTLVGDAEAITLYVEIPRA